MARRSKRSRRASQAVRPQVDRPKGSSDPLSVVLFLLVGLAALVVVCAACWMVTLAVRDRFDLGADESEPQEVRLILAYSPEKATLIETLIQGFNEEGYRAANGLPMRVDIVELEPEAMLQAAVDGEFQAMTPDSSVWLPQLDALWAERTATPGNFIVGQTTHYAVSPVVIAMWRDVAQDMGYGQRSLGWSDLLARAQSDPDFKWSHPSTASASGLLATLAEFYAGAGKTWGLTAEDVQDTQVLNYVSQIEKTVRYYGQGEWAVVNQVVKEGRDYLDAFVCQEQLVVWANQQGADLVAIYPVEGSLWQDHPLVLLETPDLSGDQRQVFAQLVSHLRSGESQQLVLEAGYRPADTSMPLDSPGSPLNATYGVDPTQPKTALQIPGAEVVEVVRDVWWYTKRHTNVFLVVDTSGSMEGEKIANVRQALQIFIEQIKGPEESVGLIEFATDVRVLVPLDKLGANRDKLLLAIGGLEASGDTALIDGVDLAYQSLQALDDRERINAIVVMTDGRENFSYKSLSTLTFEMRQGNETGVPVVVLAVAYGDDADEGTLQTLVDATEGQVYKGTLETIRQLYKILSTYF